MPVTLAANATVMMSRRIGRQLDREPPSVLGKEAAEPLEAVGDVGRAERKPGHSCDARDDGLSRVALEKVDSLEVADVSAAQEHPVGLPPAEPPRMSKTLLGGLRAPIQVVRDVAKGEVDHLDVVSTEPGDLAAREVLVVGREHRHTAQAELTTGRHDRLRGGDGG